MSILDKSLGSLQNLGKAILLPVAVLPIAGLLLRLGAGDLFDNKFMFEAGLAIFKNLPLLFAIGIAGGLARDNHVSAGLAGAVAYEVMKGSMLAINPANDMAVLGGVIGGLIGGSVYNRFSNMQLPVVLAFFSGRRFVPIASGFFALITALVFSFIWPPLNSLIQGAGAWVIEAGSGGLFVYGVLNRFLIPTGLQHILEKTAYYVIGSFTMPDGTIITGDQSRFFVGDSTAGIFMSGFFPVMIFGLPAAALAMYHSAKKERRILVAGLLISASLTALLTGVTEPIEFPILFSAPLLFLFHSIMMGVSFAVCHMLGYQAGFTFSGGIIDMALSWGISTKPWLIFIIGPIFSVIYYFGFLILIRLLNAKTPGREDDNAPLTPMATPKNYKEKAELYMSALGGKANLVVIDNCATRLRLKVVDQSLVLDAKLKALGAAGVIKTADNLQVIIGADVEFLATALKEI